MSTRLEVQNLTKSFPGVQALSQVSLRAHRGEVLAVVGENGAGKSTLMKILAGIYSSDSGTITLDEKPVHFHTVRDSLHAGIVLIHQELNLAESLSVESNLFLGRERCDALGLLNRPVMQAESQDLLRRVGLNVSPDTPISRLTIAQRQLVEIA